MAARFLLAAGQRMKCVVAVAVGRRSAAMGRQHEERLTTAAQPMRQMHPPKHHHATAAAAMMEGMHRLLSHELLPHPKMRLAMAHLLCGDLLANAP